MKQQKRAAITQAKRWVVKLGSSLLTGEQGLASAAIQQWASQISVLRSQGIEVVLVSSGAVAAGLNALQLTERPEDLSELQAAAAVGQLSVANAWRESLAKFDVQAAQVLLTHEESANRERFLNARNTLQQLLQWSVVPVINENDTVATEEIRFGDNDRLAALAAELVSADVLLILTDQAGMFDADPRLDPQAQLISETDADDAALDEVAGASGGNLGRGGMHTKLLAARMASGNGISTLIAAGAESDILLRLANGEPLGTLLRAQKSQRSARKRWLAVQQRVRGRLFVDAGAAKAIAAEFGNSLLTVGLLRVEGNFQRGDLLACIDPDGRECARGLSNYSSQDAARLCGLSSADVIQVLGRPAEAEIIHRDNLLPN